MKKIRLIISVIMLLLIPFVVKAETCNGDDISISSITMEEKSRNVIELDEATADGKNINVNLSMTGVGDNIKYKVEVNNESKDDYELDENSFNLNSDYIDYTIEPDDGNTTVKAGEVKGAVLTIQYSNKVPYTEFNGGSYNIGDTMLLNLSSEGKIEEGKETIVDKIINPNTAIQSYIIIALAVLIVSIVVYFAFAKKKKSLLILIIGLVAAIPISVINALCKYEVKVESNIVIDENNYLMGDSGGSISNYLRTSVQRKNVETITFVDSTQGHEINNVDCWDASLHRTGKILVWIADEDADGLYEFTIGSDEPMYGYDGMFLFREMENLTHIYGLENLDTSYMTRMNSMFYGDKNLVDLDLTSFNTSQVTSMEGMFENCEKLEELDLSHFDTSKVTNMLRMFAHAKSLTSLNLSGWDTSKVTNMILMFQDCNNLETLDVSHFDTSSVTYMYQMFTGLYKVTSLDLSNFDTSKVTDLHGMFNGCRALETLDISSWDTSNVTNISSMFIYDQNLKTIYVGEKFVTDNVTSSNDMFTMNYAIVGGAGTTYNSSNPTDKTYAHVDGGSSNPGYFTAK